MLNIELELLMDLDQDIDQDQDQDLDLDLGLDLELDNIPLVKDHEKMFNLKNQKLKTTQHIM